MKSFKRILSIALALCCAIGCMAGMTTTASAAAVADATIDTDANCSITLYKYDWSNAVKDGVWDSSYVTTGIADSNVENILGNAIRTGDINGSKDNLLGDNKQNSDGYAIKGVEFSYMKVADIVTFTESKNDGHEDYNMIQVLYGFDKIKAEALLNAIGIGNGSGSYANAANTDSLDQSKWYYTSDVLNKALADSLAANATTVKNALEIYVKANRDDDASINGAMPLTDEGGKTWINGLKVGLYLMVETKVPEMVTTTVNPFFLSMPMTSVDGGYGKTGEANATDGGHRWIYDVTLYPKNETGIVTLEKTVREAKKDTAARDGSATDIADVYKHYATASAGDTVEYQIISTLPTITSAATSIAEYTFQDILAKGLTYSNDRIKIEWFKDADCDPENKVAQWMQGDGKFTVTQEKNADNSYTMIIAMTDEGLVEINTANTIANNSNGTLYAGYSNYTIRITYSAIVNSDESVVYGDEGNNNEVVLTWRRSSSEYYDTLIDDCHVFTYGINLSKVWSDKTPAEAKTAGLYDHVLFTVQNKTDGYYVIAKLNKDEGVWYVTGNTTSEAAATNMYPVTWNIKDKAGKTVSSKDGQLVIKGLEDDQYILTEVKTAKTYTLLKDDISIVITSKDDAARPCKIYGKDAAGLIQNDARFNFDNGQDLALANIPQKAMAHNMLTASATVDGNKVTMLNDEVDTISTNAMVPLTVTNTHGFDLPQTGQTGAKWMPIIGGSMIGLAALVLFFLVVVKRKEEDSHSA